MTEFALCGWRVRSALLLPEVQEWGGSDSPVDLEIISGAMPGELGESSPDLPYLQMLKDGSVIFDAIPHARFRVSASRVVVDLPRPDAPDWRALLLGPVLGLICYIRGRVPLHASAVRINGRAVAFAGRSGAGKSTLAATLCARGHEFITDDISPISFDGTTALIHPTYPAMKLDIETLRQCSSEQCTLLGILRDAGKMQIRWTIGFWSTPLPLDTIYVIEDAQEGMTDRIESATGIKGFERLSADLYRPHIGRFLSGRPSLFSAAAQLAAKTEVRRIVRQRSRSKLTALAQLIEQDAAHLRQRISETIET